MRQHASHHTPQNNGFVSRFRVNTFLLAAEMMIELVNGRIKGSHIREVVLKAACAAEGFEQFHRCPAAAFTGEKNVKITARIGNMPACGVRTQNDFILRILRINDRSADQIRISLFKISINSFADLDDSRLLKVDNGSVQRNNTSRESRIGSTRSRRAGIQKQGVVSCRLQYGFGILFCIGCSGSKTVTAVLCDAGTDTAGFAAAVLHQVPFQQNHPPGPVFMSAKDSLYAVGEVFRLRTDYIVQHNSSCKFFAIIQQRKDFFKQESPGRPE